MTHSKFIIFLLGFGFLMANLVSEAMDNTSLPKRELLLLQEIPVVITPTKVAQPILESPSSITVLTKEDIRRYGMTSFADILRNVPGVDVMSMSPTDRNISMRGFNELVAGKILTLVDNLPIYMDFFGMTLWEALPVSIDEIERIEIIRGPGSALYGANAFDGVVNIITDSASEAVGTNMTAAVDHHGEMQGSIIHGGGMDDLTYKASAGWDRHSGWDDVDADVGKNTNFSGYLWYTVNDNSDIRLSGKIQNSLGDMVALPSSAPTGYNTTESDLRVNYTRSDMKFYAFHRRTASTGDISDEVPYQFENNTFDSELQYSFRPIMNNSITCGLNYRFNRIDSTLLDALHNQNLWAVYIQDQFKFSRALALTAGLRYDKHPLTGSNISPRGSIVYSPWSGHAFRASAGKAFRNPPLIYSYALTNYKISTPLFPAPIDVKIIGNKELVPEWMTSFEFGYQGTFGGRLRGGIDLFFSKTDGLTAIKAAETHDENALFPGSPGGIIPSVMSMFNDRDADAQGGEVSADLSVTRWLSAYGNYSYQRISDSKTEEEIRSAPRHKINSGLCLRLGRSFLINVFANYVDGTVWENTEVDPYMILNSMISYKMGAVEARLSISNILNDRHLEHPQGDEIGRSMVLSLTYRMY